MPTISIEANTTDARTVAADALQAVVFGEIMKPLAKALGPVGDIAVESVAQHLFVRSRS